MKHIKHETAASCYYDSRALQYDEVNEHNSKVINALIENILKEHKCSTILDLTCGTGSQVFWLHQRGFEVVGSDMSPAMLAIARQKAVSRKVAITFIEADCRFVQIGQFDAVITIFNSIGHLTRNDFILACQNIYRNLKPGGLYIFDIFNQEYLQYGNNITKLTCDWIVTVDGKQLREVQFSTISVDGILRSYSTYIAHNEQGFVVSMEPGYENTLQLYSAIELQDLLIQCGFVVLAQTDIEGNQLSKKHSERIVTVAQKTA